MQTLTITLGLDELIVTRIQEKQHQLHLFVESRRTRDRCPACRRTGSSVQKYTEIIVRDLPVFAQQVYLHVKKKWFRCQNPNCQRSIFAERFQSLHTKKHLTKRYAQYLYTQSGHATYQVLETEHAIAKSTLWRLMFQASRQKLHQKVEAFQTVTCLGIDEFSYKKHHHYHTILTDLDRHKPLWMLKKRTKAGLTRFLKRCPKLRVCVIDMSETFYQAIREHSEKICIVIDKFHVIQTMTRALDSVRRQFQSALPQGKKIPYIVHAICS
jgi:transposase